MEKKHTPETIEKIRAWHKGRTRSKEFRIKMRQVSKGRITPEIRAKAIKANTGSRRSDETRAKMREIAKSRSELWEKNRQQAIAAYRERHERDMFELIGELLRQNVPAKEIIKQTGLSQTTFYRWRKRFNTK